MLKPFRYAFDGISWSFRNHRNFQIHTGFAFIALISGLLLNIARQDWILLLFTIILVYFAEMVNTALEEITDLVTVKWAKQAKIAKDVSAGMVLITAAGAIMVGLLVFIPYLSG